MSSCMHPQVVGPSMHPNVVSPCCESPLCRANQEHVRQSRLDCGLGFQVTAPQSFKVVPSSLGSGEQAQSAQRARRTMRAPAGMTHRLRAHRICVQHPQVMSPACTIGRANSEHIRQSRPDSGLGFQAKVPQSFKVVPSSLGSGKHAQSASRARHTTHAPAGNTHRLCAHRL